MIRRMGIWLAAGLLAVALHTGAAAQSEPMGHQTGTPTQGEPSGRDNATGGSSSVNRPITGKIGGLLDGDRSGGPGTTPVNPGGPAAGIGAEQSSVDTGGMDTSGKRSGAPGRGILGLFGLLGLGGLAGLTASNRTRSALGSAAVLLGVATALAWGSPAQAQRQGDIGAEPGPAIGTGSGQKLPQSDVSGVPSTGNPGSGEAYEGVVGKDKVNTNSLRTDNGMGQWGMLGLLGLAGLLPLLNPRDERHTREATTRERHRGTA